MERTQKANKNWESYSDEDMDSREEPLEAEELSLDPSGTSDSPSPSRQPLKRAMAEEKLQEKRLKERARRNGMAGSIDEMRTLVPEIIESKKNYSQAKVVAFALQHIYDLQRENDSFRQRLGLPSRMDEFRAQRATKASGKHKKERPALAASAERSRKRRRLNDDSAQSTDPVPASAAAVAADMAVAAPAESTDAPVASVVAAPQPILAEPAEAMDVDSSEPEHEPDASLELDFVTDSLAASPALSPHALEDDLAMPHPNFDNFDHAAPSSAHSRLSMRSLDWENAPHDTFESFFVDHLLPAQH